MAIVTMKDLPAIREKYKDKKIVFCAGCFDLTHAGHVLFFEDCKKLGDILVVQIGTDFNLRLYKGEDRPIMNQHIRLKNVDSLKPVDYALLDVDAPHKDFLNILNTVFAELKPDVYVVNDDAFDLPRRYELVKGTRTELVILERKCPPEFEGITTSNLIKKIRSLK